jgi:hypothetical protein
MDSKKRGKVVISLGMAPLVMLLAFLKVYYESDLSWVWVFAPLWIPWAIILTIFAVPVTLIAIAAGIAIIADYFRSK